jgi:uncharacterized glyoxalase superfamily protein PhnB
LLRNRSVPADVLLPHLVYRDVPAALAWLSAVFGFTEHYRYGSPDRLAAQIYLGNACVMLGSGGADATGGSQPGRRIEAVTIFIDDVEAHFERAKRAGAKIVENPHETVYGEFQYAAEDLEGHLWLFSRHARDVNPSDWGATVATPPHQRLPCDPG